jgi:hypothetical protein
MFSKDFKEFIQLLNKNQVEYLIVGGYAVGFHGYPRYTGDIDIWLNPIKTNVSKMASVLEEFGFSPQHFSIDDFQIKDNIVRIGFPPNRIDLLVSIDGVDFNECYPNRVIEDLGGTKVNFIGVNDLIKNKKACNRTKDQIDLENLS